MGFGHSKDLHILVVLEEITIKINDVSKVALLRINSVDYNNCILLC